MAKRDKGGMGAFDSRNHIDKDDPGMPQFLRALNKKKHKKDEPKKEMKHDKMMNHLQDFVK